MNEKCELLDTCGFFLNFKGNTDLTIISWFGLFCENYENSQNCERKKIRTATGKPPVDNMCPTGKIID